MHWDLTGSSLGDSLKGSGSSPGDRRKKTIRLTVRLSEAVGLAGKKRKADKTLKKSKGKGRSGKAKIVKKDSTKDKGKYFHYNKDGYRKRKCNDYLAKKAKHKLGEG
ncbi:hypothetical protein GW17_00054588 [Ensete ventricosum]|nr:hypothetical protein GW17_00054588 [Ensete ventricosum]